MADPALRMVLEPSDEYPHEPDDAPNYNESMYLNAFDVEREVGAWFRIGNRVNEGYAEVSVCVYLPGGRVGFLYGRPRIDTNDEMRAGGLHIEVLTPFEQLRVTFDGEVCLLDEPRQMANPRQAFADNPMVPCQVALDVRGISPMYGGRPVREDGSDVEIDPEKSFAKAHYEQHIAATGTITVGDEVIDVDGLGLRDKSWGPRHWQAVRWYRWLPMVFGRDIGAEPPGEATQQDGRSLRGASRGEDSGATGSTSPKTFAMMISIIGGDDPDVPPRRSGMVLEDGEYSMIRDCTVESDWDDDRYQTGMRCWVRTDTKEFELTGEVLSLIPLRNRRTTPDGEQLTTRITEAMTRFTCDGRRGIGMSEYLDQVVDGLPVGPDVT